MRVFILRAALAAVLATILAATLVGCGGSPGVEGKYTAHGASGKTVSLTLKPDASGEWETATDAVSLRWEASDGKVWLHSKNGGVIQAEIRDGTLAVTLPGEGDLIFRRPGAKP
ncbi:MAG: hypothetical protein AB7E47_14920 [Desulfovibrionaceae bacterium]